jgi:diguanylate cyclase (GGDEF)-like protein
VRLPIPPSTLLSVIATQNEIVARSLPLDEAASLVCARAAELTSASGAVFEMFEDGCPGAHCGSAGSPDVVTVPLVHCSRRVGVLKVFSPRRQRLAADPAEVLRLLCEVVAAHLEQAQQDETIERAARRDQLTGLGNGAYYDQRLAREVDAAVGAGRHLSLCLLELDGDSEGDEGVWAVARILQGLRESDDAFRIGEREFAVLLPGTSLLGGRVVAERLADRIAGVGHGRLSARYGVAAMTDPDPRRLHAAAAQLIGQAGAVPAGA